MRNPWPRESVFSMGEGTRHVMLTSLEGRRHGNGSTKTVSTRREASERCTHKRRLHLTPRTRITPRPRHTLRFRIQTRSCTDAHLSLELPPSLRVPYRDSLALSVEPSRAVPMRMSCVGVG